MVEGGRETQSSCVEKCRRGGRRCGGGERNSHGHHGRWRAGARGGRGEEARSMAWSRRLFLDLVVVLDRVGFGFVMICLPPSFGWGASLRRKNRIEIVAALRGFVRGEGAWQGIVWGSDTCAPAWRSVRYTSRGPIIVGVHVSVWFASVGLSVVT
jgi:hypothetical protein